MRELAEARSRLQADREKARAMGLEIRGITPSGRIFELRSVAEGRVPLYLTTDNENAAASTRADIVQAVHGGAPGMLIGIWDGGAVRVTHREFGGRVRWLDGTYAVHPHPTHVAGTLIAAGVREGARGMAYEADLVSREWNLDTQEAAIAASEGLLLSNHSYGFVRGWTTRSGTFYWYGDVEVSEEEDYLFGFYDGESREWDEVANDHPMYLAVNSAGNDRNDGPEPGTSHYYWNPSTGSWTRSTAVRQTDGGEDGFDCIPNGMALSKNVLTVGAVEDVLDYGGPDSVRMTEFSSWGPADDGRIKPDISGNGFQLLSAVSENDEAYGIYSGTSMASPNVCGSLALLQSRYTALRGRPMEAATLKALALGTASEAGPHPGPDYAFGWGLLDAWAAYSLIESDPDGRRGAIAEFTLHEGRTEEFFYEWDGVSDTIRATICWNDPAGEIAPRILDPREPRLVNDLDLRVREGETVHMPWTLDPDAPGMPAQRGDNTVDNVEQVIIGEPAGGVLTVAVSGKGDLDGGMQRFSLIVSGARRTNTWHVYEDGSGDVPTLGAAVRQASPGDQVFVFPGTYFERDILIDRDMEIIGMGGPGSVTIDAGGLGRCFHITGEGVTAEIGAVRMTGGKTDEGGGAIMCDEGASLILTSSRLEGNSSDEGGAIGVDEGALQVFDCEILDNTAMGSGGGIFASRSEVSCELSVLAGNSAESGGAVSSIESTCLIEGCTVAFNSADRASGVLVGGAGSLDARRTIISFGSGGAGIYVERENASVEVECCNLWENEGGDYGGAIEDRTGTGGNISADPVFCGAGEGDLTVGDGSPCLPARNPCGERMGARGAGCHTLRTAFIRPDGTGDYPSIQEALDAAEPGDTIMLAPGLYEGQGNRDLEPPAGTLVITSVAGAEQTVLDCSGGGSRHYGFYFGAGHDSTTVLEGVTVTGGLQGGIIVENGAAPLIRDCIVTGNEYSSGWHGGGITIQSASPTIRRCLISDNRVGEDGGGIYCKTAAPLIEDCEITGNFAGGAGGGIAAWSGSSPVIRDCTITGNSADSESGGGIWVITAEALVSGCVISGNTADFGGGGIFSGTNGVLTVENTVVSGNSTGSVGGGVYSGFGMTMTGCTIVDNYTVYYGAGLEVYDGRANRITSSIIAFNRNAGGIFTISGDVDISCSDVFGNEGGEYTGSTRDMTGLSGNVSTDPLFCGLAEGDFRLDTASPLFDPPDPSCAAPAGALGAGCGSAPDLAFSSVSFDTTRPGAGTVLGASAVVRNTGSEPAGAFAVDLFEDLEVAPEPGRTGIRRTVAGLAPGDSATVGFDLSSGEPAEWSTWLLIDSEGLTGEFERENNTAGPFEIVWTAGGASGVTSSGIVSIDPNPFTDETGLTVAVTGPSRVDMEIFDVAGRRIKGWSMEPAAAGSFTVTWDGTNFRGEQVASGVYFCRFLGAGVKDTRKIIRIR